MKLLTTDNYIDFACIGGTCPISCCGGDWTIVVDEETAKYYRSVEGEFGEKLRDGLEDVEENTIFKLDENKDCIFLNENKLCSIYRNLGEDKMCYTCKTYPRHFYQVGDILFCNLANSCPEVTRMILQRTEPLKTVLDDNYFSNEIADRISGQTYDHDNIDWVRFNSAISAFTTGMSILQNRDLKIKDRMSLLLFYIERLEKIIKQGEDTKDLTTLFSMPEVYALFLETEVFKIRERDYTSKIHAFLMVFKILLSQAYKHPMWKRCNDLADKIKQKEEYDIDALTLLFDRFDSDEYQIELEQLITYRFFVVFMQGFENSDYFEKLAYEYVLFTSLITYSVLTEHLQGYICSREDRILFYSLCSRFDHSSGRKEKLNEIICSDGYCEMEKLMQLIG